MDDRTDAAQSAEHAGSRESSVKETLESILIAFVLAFIFRAFVVEAFVIPTGSMATTLLGAHIRLKCPDCGNEFTVNYNTPRSSGEDISIPPYSEKSYNVDCPNCGYHVPGERDGDPAYQPPVSYGDRILVLKYLYLMRKPQRWDVVVFKSPDKEQGTPPNQPPTYTQNYIKRLIGTPGETIVILDGDIYVGHGDDLSACEIQTKPPHVQKVLWRPVYNNDYFPLGLRRLKGFRQPWTVREGSGWNGPTGGATPVDVEKTHAQQRTFEFDNLNGGSTIAFDPQANPNTHALTDWLVYDVEQPSLPNPVSDLKIGFYYERQAGDGALRLKLTKGDDAFIAELTTDRARVIRENASGQTVIGESALASSGKVIAVEFSNHDYQVKLRVDGHDLVVSTRQQYFPDVGRLLEDYRSQKRPSPPSVEISAQRQRSRFTHLGLWRDIYYINTGARFDRYDRRLPIHASPLDPAKLGPDEYFTMGDNSLLSSDARMWSWPIDLPYEDLQAEAGRVPGRFLLGRAFFVYWPAGFRPFGGLPPLAPDFGDMRFIH